MTFPIDARQKKLSKCSVNIRLLNERTDSFAGSFVYPGTDFVDSIKVDGQCTGYVDYGMSPLRGRVYINMINIEPAHPMQEIALKVLWQLWLSHRVPIIPLHQHILTNRFWSLARSQFVEA